MRCQPTLVLTLLVGTLAAPMAQSGSPAAAADALLATDRAFAESAPRSTLVDALVAMFRDDVTMGRPGGWAQGRDEAKAALLGNAANATSHVSWTPLRAGISADGLHGFTLGVMTATLADGSLRPAKYIAYWIKTGQTWRVAAYKRAPAGAGTPPREVMPASLPPALVEATADPQAVEAHRASLVAAERAFSDDAQVMGVGPAFVKWGRVDAVNMGDPANPGFTVGAEAIGAGVGGPGPATIEWSADRALVASSGDLGVTFGAIRTKDGSRPPIPFFTIWRRDNPTAPWRYIAE